MKEKQSEFLTELCNELKPKSSARIESTEKKGNRYENIG